MPDDDKDHGWASGHEVDCRNGYVAASTAGSPVRVIRGDVTELGGQAACAPGREGLVSSEDAMSDETMMRDEVADVGALLHELDDEAFGSVIQDEYQ
jgi:hypothetical protein